MKNIFFLITLILFSCNSKEKSENQSEVTYRILIKENNKHNSYITDNIKNKINGKTNIQKIVRYDSLTNDYLNYLLTVENEISNKTTKILFEGDEFSSTGKAFINKTKAYKLEIEKLVESENLKKRINLALNTNDIQYMENEIAENNETNERLIGKIYIHYLDYYFRGFPKNQALAFLSNKKKNILVLENEFIDSTINK